MQGEREKLFNARGRLQGDRTAFAGADKAYFIAQIRRGLAEVKAATDIAARGMALQGLDVLLRQEAVQNGQAMPSFDADLVAAARAALKRLQEPPKPPGQNRKI